jgi:hypothetical protein
MPKGELVPVFALIAWIVTALGGLFLLAIFLIEYDPDFQRAAATRLPLPVLSGHVLLALGGLVVWILYLLSDNDQLAYITLLILIGAATLGTTMAIRWIGVYRTRVIPVRTGPQPGERGDAYARRASSDLAVPPERHFPVAVVVGHGLFAAVTISLVLLTTLGVGGS